MKRNAFTMIELIFVIVILGILAAIAIPKLMATRTDAQITKARADVKTMINEIQGYAAATGSITTPTEMSPTVKKYVNEGKARVDGNNTIILGCVDLNFTINNTTHDINLTVARDSNTDIICQGIQKGVFGDLSELNYSLRGKRVTY